MRALQQFEPVGNWYNTVNVPVIGFVVAGKMILNKTPPLPPTHGYALPCMIPIILPCRFL
jgi:hypothetical protein